MTELTSREQAWAQLHDCLHDRLHLPRLEWPEDLERKQAEAEAYLTEHPASVGEPVQIVLSQTSLGQVRDVMEQYLDPLKETVEKIHGAVDLINRMADAREMWLAILDPDTIVRRDGKEISLTKPEQGYLRALLGDMLKYAGRPDYLTEYLGETPVPPMPAPPKHRPDPGDMVSEVPHVVQQPVPVQQPAYQQPAVTQVPVQQPGLQVSVVEAPAPQAVPQNIEAMSPLAQARARRAALPTDSPSPNTQPQQPPGVEVWEGAPAHDCKEWLDVDDQCQQCGRVVMPTRPQVYDVPMG